MTLAVRRAAAAGRAGEAQRRAIVGLSSRRSTIASIIPFSRRNSLRWNPSGSFCRMVCSITRGPAKPMSALGSAMFTSPSMAKLAVTPPVVGSVSTEMYGSSGAVEPRERRADLGHLHQRERAFHHPRAARAGHDHDRDPPVERPLDRRA